MLKSLLTRQHSQVPAEEGGERLEGNTNNGRVQGFSQTIKKQEKKSDLGKKESVQTASQYHRGVWNLDAEALKTFTIIQEERRKSQQIKEKLNPIR